MLAVKVAALQATGAPALLMVKVTVPLCPGAADTVLLLPVAPLNNDEIVKPAQDVLTVAVQAVLLRLTKLLICG